MSDAALRAVASRRPAALAVRLWPWLAALAVSLVLPWLWYDWQHARHSGFMLSVLSQTGMMVIFALSCFGILTFLWVGFGGSVPLKPKTYEVKVDFPEATTLAEQADVRISGVPVGKVQHKQLDGHYIATAYAQTGVTASGEYTHRHVVAADPALLQAPVG